MRRVERVVLKGLASTVAVVATGVAMAHHSAAMYDVQKKVTLIGTIKEFQWTNPHCWIQLVVEDAGGKSTEWSIETVSPPGLKKHGWTRDAVKAGDKATVVFMPLKSGEHGGGLISVTVNGKMIGDGPL